MNLVDHRKWFLGAFWAKISIYSYLIWTIPIYMMNPDFHKAYMTVENPLILSLLMSAMILSGYTGAKKCLQEGRVTL